MKFAKVLFFLFFLIALLLVPVFRAVSQKTAPGTTTITYGIAEDANTYVPPPQIQRSPTQLPGVGTAQPQHGIRSVQPEGRASAAQSQFIVSYSGFTTEARAAFQYAVDIWAALIQTSVPIRISVTLTDLGGKRNGFLILGTAGPSHRIVLTGHNTWMVAALADAVAGRNLVPSYSSDISATFNSNSEVGWYYGTDGNTPSGQMDFVSVVLHEIGHGLGFISLAGPIEINGVTEGKLRPTNDPDPYIYDTFVVNGSGTVITTFEDPSAALSAQLTENNLFWDGTQGKAANSGIRPKLFVPDAWDPGGSFSHLSEFTFPAGDPDSLMTPFFSRAEAIHHPGPIALGMLEDMGWTINYVPAFIASTTTRSVAENTAAGVNIGDPVAAIDANNDTLTYSLSGTDATSFDIESSTGQLKTKAALNYETKRVYRVTVTANDGAVADTISVTINVTDVNDAPVFTDGSTTTRAIVEGTSADRNIGLPVSATDEDARDTLTYSLSGADATSFDIESSTGQLKTEVSLNYNIRNTYSVRVTATDKDGDSDDISVTINIIDAIDFTDSGLAAAVRSALRIASNAPILPDRFASLTNLTASRKNITDLTGLEQATELTRLDLGDNQIDDLGPIANLTRLTNLDLANNHIVNVPSLSALSRLTNLDLDDNQITNVSTLPSLRSLQTLDLRGNNVGDVTPVSTMTHLKYLYISGNDNLTNIKQLVKLKEAGTRVDITLPVAVTFRDDNLKSELQSRLGLGTDDPIFPEDMETLTNFNGSNLSITTLTGLEKATNLTSLDLSNNTISSLSPLSRLKNLESLDLSENNISSISSLAGLTALTSLNLENNRISSISSLTRLISLTSLDLADNSISSITTLSKLIALTSLDLANNRIRDVLPLQNLSSLRTLNLEGNNDITNIVVLYRLRQNQPPTTIAPQQG